MAEAAIDVDAEEAAGDHKWRDKVQQLATTFGNSAAALTDEEFNDVSTSCYQYMKRDLSGFSEELYSRSGLFRDLGLCSEELEQYPLEARRYFIACSCRMVSETRAIWLEEVFQQEWGIDPLSVLDKEFPPGEISNEQLADALRSHLSVDESDEEMFFKLIKHNPQVARVPFPEDTRNVNMVFDHLSNAILTSERASGAIKILSRDFPAYAVEAFSSGSRRELVADSESDRDVMIELGPAELVRHFRTSNTANPGFVVVSVSNPHSSASGESQETDMASYRKLLITFVTGKGRGADVTKEYHVNRDGTGASFKLHTQNDTVICLSGAEWPAEEYRKRQKYQGYVTAQMVECLASETAHWVPKGCKGSATEDVEWRISFSKLEAMLVGYMLHEAHRECLVILKMCKRLLGLRANSIKTYHLKTCLMWQAEVTAQLDVQQNVRAMLTRLMEAVQQGHLPCFFWPQVNVLGGLGQRELQKLQAAVRLLDQCLPQLLACAVASDTIIYLQRTESQLGHGTFSQIKQVVTQQQVASPLWKFWIIRYQQCVKKLENSRMLEEMIVERKEEVCASVPTMAKLRVASRLLAAEQPWAWILVEIILGWPGCKVLLLPRQTRSGLQYWVMDLSWFLQPSRRWYFVLHLSEVDRALCEQAALPADRRLVGLQPDFCRPVDQLSAQQLQRLLLTEDLFLARILCTVFHTPPPGPKQPERAIPGLWEMEKKVDVKVMPGRTAIRLGGDWNRVDRAVDVMCKLPETDDFQDPWMPEYIRQEREAAAGRLHLFQTSQQSNAAHA